MKQEKIGMFIKECRKVKNLTQQDLADKLGVSFKTISKWECGKGLPDPSLMLPLCEELEINVNELLSGCHIQKEDYMEKAEENLLDVVNEKKINKKRMVLMTILGILSISTILALIMVASFVEMKDWLRIVVIIVGMLVLLIEALLLCVMDNDIGYFECQHCKKRFVPSTKAYIFAPHSLTSRLLRCPHCNKVSFCKKKLTK